MVGAQVVVDAVTIHFNIFRNLVDVTQQVIEEGTGAFLDKRQVALGKADDHITQWAGVRLRLSEAGTTVNEYSY